MKKYIIVMLSVVSMAAMAQTKSVAILETYCADNSISSAYLMMIGSNLETGIIKNPQYTAYNRAQVNALISEHKFQRSGLVNDSEIRRLGQMAGVDYVLASEAALLEKQVFVTAKVLNVETGQYEMSDNELMDFNPSAIQRGCQNLAAKLLGGGSTPQEIRAQSTNPEYLKVKVKFTQLSPTLCEAMDYTVHRILQARILEWVACPFPRGSSQPRDRT